MALPKPGISPVDEEVLGPLFELLLKEMLDRGTLPSFILQLLGPSHGPGQKEHRIPERFIDKPVGRAPDGKKTPAKAKAKA